MTCRHLRLERYNWPWDKLWLQKYETKTPRDVRPKRNHSGRSLTVPGPRVFWVINLSFADHDISLFLTLSLAFILPYYLHSRITVRVQSTSGSTSPPTAMPAASSTVTLAGSITRAPDGSLRPAPPADIGIGGKSTLPVHNTQKANAHNTLGQISRSQMDTFSTVSSFSAREQSHCAYRNPTLALSQ